MLVVLLAIIAGLLSSSGNEIRTNAGISFIFLFMVAYSFGWTPMCANTFLGMYVVLSDPDQNGYRQATYPSEVLSYQARAKGLSFLGIVSQVASLINTFGCVTAHHSPSNVLKLMRYHHSLPVALQKLGWKGSHAFFPP